MAAGLLYAEKGSLTNFVLCKILSDYDTIHAVDGSMVVLYDEGAENYNLLTNDVNNNFETGSCLDFRKYSSFNSNKTGTFNYDDALSLVNDYVTAIYKNDASSFVFNLKKGTYEIPLDKILSIAGKFDFRTFNSKGTFFSKGGKKDSSYIHHYFLFDIVSRPVVINGNGAEIKLTGSSGSKDNHFAFVPKH